MPTRSTFRVRVTDEQGRRIRNAEIQFLWEGNATANRVLSDPDQDVVLEAEHPETDRHHAHRLRCEAFGVEETKDVRHGETVHFQLTLQFQFSLQSYSGNELVKTDRAVDGRRVLIQAASPWKQLRRRLEHTNGKSRRTPARPNPGATWKWYFRRLEPRPYGPRSNRSRPTVSISTPE